MIALFVLKLATGITMMWWLMPRKDVTDGFFRIQTRLLLGLAVLATLLLTGTPTWNDPVIADGSPAEFPAEETWTAVGTARWIRGMMMAVAVISYLGSIVWALGRRLPGNLCIHSLSALCVAALALHAVNVPNATSVVHQLLADFSSAAVAGGMLTGMLLGHWYLTTPTMSITPLWWFNKAILTAAGLRCVASLWTLLSQSAIPADSTQQIWLGIRWLGGIAAPVFVVLMVWRILKHRNTQSATGVLFAGLILVFMGEMTAALLERATLLPW
ncbi:MAG: hypothetical protein R3C59_29505 [Planctomycetaceae bacterium]